MKCEKCGRFVSKTDVNIIEIPMGLSVDQYVLCGRCSGKSGCLESLDRYSSEYDCEYKTWLDCSDCMFGSWGGRKDPRSQKYQ